MMVEIVVEVVVEIVVEIAVKAIVKPGCHSILYNRPPQRQTKRTRCSTVLIGKEDSMVNKIVPVNKIVWFVPSLRHCGESLDKIVW